MRFIDTRYSKDFNAAAPDKPKASTATDSMAGMLLFDCLFGGVVSQVFSDALALDMPTALQDMGLQDMDWGTAVDMYDEYRQDRLKKPVGTNGRRADQGVNALQSPITGMFSASAFPAFGGGRPPVNGNEPGFHAGMTHWRQASLSGPRL